MVKKGFTKLFVSYLILVSTSLWAQQVGRISGRVTSDGQTGLEGISVVVQERTYTALTNASGYFQLIGLPLGSYTLVATGLGFQPIIREIILTTESPVLQLDLIPVQTATSLLAVEVVGRKETTYRSEYSFIGTKALSRGLDVPQTISTVTKELMEDQQVYRLNDAVKNIAGVNQYSQYDDLTVRGFRNGFESGFRLVNGLRSGFSYGNGFFRVPLTANLERLEVLKGPGAALYGDINPGGTVNLVTKKPLDEERKALSFSVGSFQTLRTALDFTGPLNKQKTLLYRLNVGYEDTETFRDVIEGRSLLIAPTVTFLPTDKTTVNAELVYSQYNGLLDRGLVIKGGDLFALPFSFALNQPSDYFKVNDLYFNASLSHRFTDWLSFNASYLKFSYSEDLSEHRTLNTFADAPDNTVMNMRYFARKAEEYTDSFTGYFVVNGATGPLQHRLLAGLDYVIFDTDKNSTMWEARQKQVDGKAVPLQFDLKKPVYALQDPTTYLRRPLPPFFIDYLNSVYHTTGLYIQDQISVGSRTKLLLGLRQELFRDRRNYGDGEEAITQHVLLPRAGLTYAIKPNINYFASYSQGFKPLRPEFIKYPQRYGNRDQFTNEASFQLESGLKGEFFDQALLATVSLYQIRKRNVLINTGQLTGEGNPVYRQNGRVESKGMEWEMTGNLSPQLNLNLTYAYNHTRVLESEMAEERGMMAANAPKHIVGLWLKYTFSLPALRGVGLAVGGTHVGRRRMESQVSDTSQGELYWAYWPAYTLADAALFYNVHKFRVALNINNLFDRKFFVGGYDYFRASPGAPRHVMATMGYTF